MRDTPQRRLLPRTLVPLPLLTACLVLTSGTVFAQPVREGIEAGIQAAAFGVRDANGFEVSTPGIAGAFSVPVAPRLMLETRVGFFPTEEPAYLHLQGGQTFQIAGGVRAELARSRSVVLNGIVGLGVVRFSDTVTPIVNEPVPIRGPATHFALDLGLSMDWPADSKWALRLEAGSTIYAVDGFVISRSEPRPLPDGRFSSITLEAPGEVKDTWQASAGVRYRFGNAERPAITTTLSGERWSAGPQFGYSILHEVAILSPRHSAAVGGFLSWRVFNWLHADGSVGWHPQEPTQRSLPARSADDGGSLLQALAGVKLGRRQGGIGTFFKFRTGVNSYSGAVDLMMAPDALSARIVRANTPIIEFGGVLEIDAGPIFLRFDASDVELLQRTGLEQNDSIVLGSGIGWRF